MERTVKQIMVRAHIQKYRVHALSFNK